VDVDVMVDVPRSSQASLEITYRKLSAHFRAGAPELLDRKRTSRAE
jgi:hypothetical protein